MPQTRIRLYGLRVLASNPGGTQRWVWDPEMQQALLILGDVWESHTLNAVRAGIRDGWEDEAFIRRHIDAMELRELGATSRP
jgi:hypothetical protein